MGMQHRHSSFLLQLRHSAPHFIVSRREYEAVLRICEINKGLAKCDQIVTSMPCSKGLSPDPVHVQDSAAMIAYAQLPFVHSTSVQKWP